MTYQSEAQLEENLIKQLGGLGYQRVTIKDEKDMLANLKNQLEKHNEVVLSNAEFAKVLNHLSKGNIFDKAKFKFQLGDPDAYYVHHLSRFEFALNCFFFKSNIARQPAPYTAKCIDDWSETEYNIQPTVNYSIAVSKLDIIALLSCTMLIVEHSIKVSV
jgi:hypothetical protein